MTTSQQGEVLPTGKGRIVRDGRGFALLSYGSRLQACMDAAKQLELQGVSATMADARFAKPLDGVLITRLASEQEVLVTVEEESIGGFAAQVAQTLATKGCFATGLKY